MKVESMRAVPKLRKRDHWILNRWEQPYQVMTKRQEI